MILNGDNMKKNNKKAFTLVELLAVIFIIGILSVITIPTINKLTLQSKEQLYKNQIDNIKHGAKNWAASNFYMLPESEGEQITLTLGQLQIGGFVASDIKDPRNKKPFPRDMEIIIKRIMNSYRYEVIEGSGGENGNLDFDSPTIILNGSAHEIVEINTNYVEKGALAKDPSGSLIDDINILIQSNNKEVDKVDTSKLVQYKITYSAVYNNNTATAIRTVTIKDTIPPNLNVPGNIIISSDEVLNYDFMEGVSATDNSLENVNITIKGTVSVLPGKYLLTYIATDSSSNKTEKTRHITVVSATYPTISIIGSSIVNINVEEPYKDMGATASDLLDGDLTNKIIVSGTVNVNIPGNYNITYEVTNSIGKTTTVIREVKVIDNIPPVIVFGTNGNSTYARNYNTKITVNDIHSLVNKNSLKYLWSTTTTTPSESSFTNKFTSGDIISTPNDLSGSYYLWIIAKDTVGNTAIKRTNAFNLDNTNPSVTNIVSNVTNITETGFTITRSGNATDAHSGLASIPYMYQISTNNVSWITNCTSSATTCVVTGLDLETKYYYRICASDKVGNQSCVASKNTTTEGGDYSIVKNVNRPVLLPGMTPIKWNGMTEVITTTNDTSWYDYTNKMWANAKTKDGSYWVWVPRYAYQISSGYHTKSAGNINIKFLQGNTNVASDNTTVATTPTYSGSRQTNYIRHPAFQFGTEEILGFWVAKFEPSGTLSNINILPNASTLTNINVKDMFNASLNMKSNSKYGWGTNTVDTHMAKNTEWGAIAYLSKSIYGANSEVWINNSNNYTTGCAGSSISASSYSGCQNAYNTTIGVRASTTHNIYGVYDMSGGANEYVTGNLNRTTASSGFSITELRGIDSKYIDVYSGYNSTIFGDAIYETSLTQKMSDFGNANKLNESWHNQRSTLIGTYSIAGRSISAPWYIRGDDYAGRELAGLFSFRPDAGNASSSYSFRPIAIPQ